MGQKKLQEQLQAGKITKAEYQKRLAQSNADKKATSGKTVRKSSALVPKRVSKSARSTTQYVEYPKQNGMSYNPKLERFMNIPKSHFLQTPVDLTNPLLAYLLTLINPNNYKSRYPDSYPKPTAIFRSIAEYSVPVNYNSTANQGLFSLCVQPKFGGIASPLQYQLAMATVGVNTWDANIWSSASSYQGASLSGDCRLDPNYYLMQGALAGQFCGLFAFNGVTAYPGASGTFNSVGYNIFNQGIVTLNPPPFGPQPTFPGNPAFGSGEITWDWISFPKGTWRVTITCTCVVSAFAINQPWKLVFNQISGIASLQVVYNTASFENTNTNNDVIVVSADLIVSCTASNGAILQVDLETQTGAGVNFNEFVNNATSMSTNLDISPVLLTASSAGFIERMRPVAQTTLVTYMGPDLVDGGQISMAYVDPDYVASNYFSSSPLLGNGQSYDALSTIPTAYNGPLKTGAYGWWSPSKEDDMDFLTISEMAAYSYPAIICSGSFTPVTSLTGGAPLGLIRVRVCTSYEFWTSSTAWDTEICAGSQAIIDEANHMLSQQPHCMPNGKHLQWLREVAKGAAQFVQNNQKLFLNLGALAVNALASL